MIELTILFGCLTIPFAIVGLWWWFGLFVSICCIFLICEVFVFLILGETLSQQFWQWDKGNRTKAKIVIICLGIGWIALLFHLAKGLF